MSDRDDPNAKYEVYVPDSTGQMSPQLMTLPEIRGLLARQGAEDEPKSVEPLGGAKVSSLMGSGHRSCRPQLKTIRVNGSLN